MEDINKPKKTIVKKRNLPPAIIKRFKLLGCTGSVHHADTSNKIHVIYRKFAKDLKEFLKETEEEFDIGRVIAALDEFHTSKSILRAAFTIPKLSEVEEDEE